MANLTQDNMTNNHTVPKSPNAKNGTSPQKLESGVVNGVKSDSPNKMDNALTEKDKPVVNDVKTSTEVKDGKKDSGTTEDDPYAGLDWKDGIATLPGNWLTLCTRGRLP